MLNVEIYNHFLKISEIDKFSKSSQINTRIIELNSDNINKWVINEGGWKDRVEFITNISVSKLLETDNIYIQFEISIQTLHTPRPKFNENFDVYFLLENDETIHLNNFESKIIEWVDHDFSEREGINWKRTKENLSEYFQYRITLKKEISKVNFTKLIKLGIKEYRTSYKYGIISEGSLTDSQKFTLITLYNFLYESSFFENQIESLYLEELKIEEIENNKRIQKENEEKIKNDIIKKSEEEIKLRQREENSKNCFIVTTTMGDINHPVVVDFRRYRDEVLLNTYFGGLFINIYYRIGPVFSKVIKSNIFLFNISKKVILKIHKLIK